MLAKIVNDDAEKPDTPRGPLVFREQAPTEAGPLQPTVFSHRQRVTIAHDDVVQHPHIHHVQRLLQQLGQFSISRAGLRASRRMVMTRRINAAELYAKARLTTCRG